MKKMIDDETNYIQSRNNTWLLCNECYSDPGYNTDTNYKTLTLDKNILAFIFCNNSITSD